MLDKYPQTAASQHSRAARNGFVDEPLRADTRSAREGGREGGQDARHLDPCRLDRHAEGARVDLLQGIALRWPRGHGRPREKEAACSPAASGER